jgi:hypothetical protein
MHLCVDGKMARGACWGRKETSAQVFGTDRNMVAAKSISLFEWEVNPLVQLLTRCKIEGLNPLLTFRCNPVDLRFYSAAAVATLLTTRTVRL